MDYPDDYPDDYPSLSFPVPLDKGIEDSENEIGGSLVSTGMASIYGIPSC